MTLSLSSIATLGDLSKIEENLDLFTHKNSSNPFLLTPFLKEKMTECLDQEKIPEIIVLESDDAIVGMAPFRIEKKFGFSYACFLSDYWFSPDLIIGEENRQDGIKETLTYLFEELKCTNLTLDLPYQSPNLPIINQHCIDQKISCLFEEEEYLNHCVIPVSKTWDEFQRYRGRNFRTHFCKIERKLDRLGPWQINLFEKENTEKQAEIVEKINTIEKKSWKEQWRSKRALSYDQDLFGLLKSCAFADKKYADFKQSLWFLELNDQPIAYLIVVQYEGTAYLAKTSYDSQYKSVYPSVYLTNKALQHLFESERITLIDFMTDKSFMQRWAPRRIPRVRVSLWKKQRLQFLFELLKNKSHQKTLKTFS